METEYISLDEDMKQLSPQQIQPLGEPLSIKVRAIGLLQPLHPVM